MRILTTLLAIIMLAPGCSLRRVDNNGMVYDPYQAKYVYPTTGPNYPTVNDYEKVGEGVMNGNKQLILRERSTGKLYFTETQVTEIQTITKPYADAEITINKSNR